MTAIGWIRITSDGTGALDRIQVPGGWLYLSLSEDRRERAMTFVPAPAEPAPTVEVTEAAAHAALCVYHDEPADDMVWSAGRLDEMRAAIEAANRARGLRP